MLTTSRTGLMAPDPLVAFNADPQAYNVNNSYVISKQGKPPAERGMYFRATLITFI